MSDVSPPSSSDPDAPAKLLARGVELALVHLHKPEAFLERFPPEAIMENAPAAVRGRVLHATLKLPLTTSEELPASVAGVLLATAIKTKATTAADITKAFAEADRTCLPHPALWAFVNATPWWDARSDKTDLFLINFVEAALKFECLANDDLIGGIGATDLAAGLMQSPDNKDLVQKLLTNAVQNGIDSRLFTPTTIMSLVPVSVLVKAIAPRAIHQRVLRPLAVLQHWIPDEPLADAKPATSKKEEPKDDAWSLPPEAESPATGKVAIPAPPKPPGKNK